MVRPNPNPGAPSQRMLRVGEQVRHALSDVLARGDVHDPELAGQIISVLEVRMSPDLRHGTVLIMPLGGKGEAEAVAALNNNAKMLRLEVSRRLRELKYSPELRFRVDDRYDEAERIERIFEEDRVRRDLEDQKKRADIVAGQQQEQQE
ncbi:MAG: ribosome-binding factor A [Rhizobiales bacterium PAR1]|nr:MAG: ribosome-binding factor A [Rhizobiales bacterium PAR1]